MCFLNVGLSIRCFVNCFCFYKLHKCVETGGEKAARSKASHRTQMQSSSAASFTVNGERSISGRQRLRDTGQTSGLGEQHSLMNN